MKTSVPTRKRLPLFPIAILILVSGCSNPPSFPLEEIQEFGSNPGELRMFKYVPRSLATARPAAGAGPTTGGAGISSADTLPVGGLPLVVALHGCMQNAHEYGENSGWIDLADRWGFLLLLPEQRRSNYLTQCFNWYSAEDNRRNTGEALSIRQMVARMQRDHGVAPERIFVTGVSAGGAMTLALAAAYPEVFAGAAPVAGIAFGCADGLLSALGCMRDPPDKKAAEWGAAVRSATSHKGPWPRISVWQGEADSAVDPENAEAIVRQWTNVHGIDSRPVQVNDLTGRVHSLYPDSNGRALVESYRIKGMGHGVPVDPGPGERQCGKAGRFFPDADICSSFWIGRSWGLDH